MVLLSRSPSKACRRLPAVLASYLPRILLIGWLSLATCAATKSDAARELRRWAKGPVRWLLLPEEWKQLRRVESKARALAFIEGFWSRRDPTPGIPGNSFREAFSRRVEAADLLYRGGVKGSLTARGRALILLGSPSHIRVAIEPMLTWDAQRRTRQRVTTREVDVEIWGYRLENLPARLLDVVRDANRGPGEALPLTLSFRAGFGKVQLVEGEVLLQLAARAACRTCE